MTRTWTIRVDAPTWTTRDGKTKTAWLNANNRGSYHYRARWAKEWRARADAAIRAAAIPPLEHVHVYCHVHRARGGRFDPSNWYDTAKPCADALVDTNVLTDDDHEHLTGPDMRAGTVDPIPLIILTIKEIK